MTERSPTKPLVIEDDEVAAAFAQVALEGAGYQVIVAVNGRAGLDAVARGEGIALVVLDIGLPDMIGYQVAARTRMDPELVDLPIVMLTARASKQDKFDGPVLAEASAYLTKSADPAALVTTVADLLGRRARA